MDGQSNKNNNFKIRLKVIRIIKHKKHKNNTKLLVDERLMAQDLYQQLNIIKIVNNINLIISWVQVRE